MTEQTQPDIQTRIRIALRATRAADKAGDAIAANYWWRECVGLIELSLGRVGSSAHLTPDPTVEAKLP